jgi:hypothetical protein
MTERFDVLRFGGKSSDGENASIVGLADYQTR